MKSVPGPLGRARGADAPRAGAFCRGRGSVRGGHAETSLIQRVPVPYQSGTAAIGSRGPGGSFAPFAGCAEQLGLGALKRGLMAGEHTIGAGHLQLQQIAGLTAPRHRPRTPGPGRRRAGGQIRCTGPDIGILRDGVTEADRNQTARGIGREIGPELLPGSVACVAWSGLKGSTVWPSFSTISSRWGNWVCRRANLAQQVSAATWSPVRTAMLPVSDGNSASPTHRHGGWQRRCHSRGLRPLPGSDLSDSGRPCHRAIRSQRRALRRAPGPRCASPQDRQGEIRARVPIIAERAAAEITGAGAGVVIYILLDVAVLANHAVNRAGQTKIARPPQGWRATETG